MAKKKPGDQNVVTSDPDPIRLLNLDKIQSARCRLVQLQIGYAIFHLRWKDVDALRDKSTASKHEIIIGSCHFTLSTEGRTSLRTVLEQAINAKKVCEQRQQQPEQERRQHIEAEWLRCMRGQ